MFEPMLTPLPPHLWLVPFFQVERRGNKILLVCFSLAAWSVPLLAQLETRPHCTSSPKKYPKSAYNLIFMAKCAVFFLLRKGCFGISALNFIQREGISIFIKTSGNFAPSGSLVAIFRYRHLVFLRLRRLAVEGIT